MDYLDIPYSAAFNQDFGLGDYNYSDFGGFSGSFVPPTSPNQVLDQGLVICLKEEETTCLEH